MGIIGYAELYTAAEGWVEIEIRNVEDMPDGADFLEINTPSGWGAIPIATNPANATTPIELYTSKGWVGVDKQAFAEVDDFERTTGLHTGWGGALHGGVYDTSSWETSTTFVRHGSRGVRLNTPDDSIFIWSKPGKRTDGQTTDLPNYLERGERLRLYYYSNSGTNQQTFYVRFAWRDANTWFMVYNRSSDALINYKIDNSGKTIAQTGTINWGAREPTWYQLDIWWGTPDLAHPNDVRARTVDLSTGNTVYDIRGNTSASYSLRNERGLSIGVIGHLGGELAMDHIHVLPS